MDGSEAGRLILFGALIAAGLWLERDPRLVRHAPPPPPALSPMETPLAALGILGARALAALPPPPVAAPPVTADEAPAGAARTGRALLEGARVDRLADAGALPVEVEPYDFRGEALRALDTVRSATHTAVVRVDTAAVAAMLAAQNDRLDGMRDGIAQLVTQLRAWHEAQAARQPDTTRVLEEIAALRSALEARHARPAPEKRIELEPTEAALELPPAAAPETPEYPAGDRAP